MSIVQDPSSVAAQRPHGAGSETTIHINEGYVQGVPVHLARYLWFELGHHKPDAQPVRPRPPDPVARLLCAQLQSQRQFVAESDRMCSVRNVLLAENKGVQKGVNLHGLKGTPQQLSSHISNLQDLQYARIRAHVMLFLRTIGLCARFSNDCGAIIVRNIAVAVGYRCSACGVHAQHNMQCTRGALAENDKEPYGRAALGELPDRR